MTKEIERWGIFELTLHGPTDGNPFVDVEFSAQFRYKNRVVEPAGFYDGDGVYKVRFMPDTLGKWTYTTQSTCEALDGQTGSFVCVSPSSGNHGPVRVRNTFHFVYEDGSPYVQIGTTCYAWAHQGDDLEAQTLKTLEASPFNKIRMCVFPKDYTFNKNEPVYDPFERQASGEWDFARFNPKFFRHFEGLVSKLRDLNIEADIILFHPYDRWGYSDMPAEADDRYLRYVVARLAAYRNVWWSMANEYDLMKSKTLLDWDRFFKIVQESDPYQHLRSVHNCRAFYDYAKPWVTHCSIQRHDLASVLEWREAYKKPVVVDECCYEGNVPHNWGNITAQELVHRFWTGMVRGGYVGHGETYIHPEDILWWSKGGVLHGESAARIAFLRDIVEAAPDSMIEPVQFNWDKSWGGKAGEYYLFYFGINQPAYRVIALPEDADYKLEIIDTWEMTVTPVSGTVSGETRVDLPSKPYMALRVMRIEG